ncbi:hypothetical protein R3P38DRAFT_3515194 [Favolaschia claudopus]|uniref:Ubiquitin-like protease family profile domain-containing protein n=1 Tax=Favolaschia claudopus TaxID=2862362 RepID=A0AAV9YZY2_9AGAR
MDNFSTFEKSDWIATGRKWSDAPPALKKMASHWFLVPQELEYEILPSPYIPIAKLLEFSLPLESTITSPESTQYFSNRLPDLLSDALILRMRRLPIPDKKTVNKLLAVSRQSWLDGNQSVIYAHLGEHTATHYPLWILTYWAAVHDIKRNAWGPWKTCQAWVNAQKRLGKKYPARAALADDTSLMLTMVPWGRGKPAGLADSEPFHTLWRFVGSHWLSGSQMDDMLELLRYKINSSPDSIRDTRIWGTALVPKLLDAYGSAAAGTYWTAPEMRWIRDLGKAIVRDRAALITSAHLGRTKDEPHWVAVIFDLTEGNAVLRYGDSLGAEIPTEMAAACRWWLNQHTAEEISITNLPIAQQKDGFSCGMLVDNAQQHFVDPEVPLTGAENWAEARLELFNKICTRSLEQLEIERALAREEDEAQSDDDTSDHHTATTPPAADLDSDSDDSPIPLLRQFLPTGPENSGILGEIDSVGGNSGRIISNTPQMPADCGILGD